MSSEPMRALVVDDDRVARMTVGFAMSQQGFRCTYAGDGDEALARLAAESFDIVITDLRMPNRHGHALVIELLSRRPRPLVVVHSSVDDPRMTKDLMLRGVDDVVLKPTNYAVFAAKAVGMVSRTRQKAVDDAAADQSSDDAAAGQSSDDAASGQGSDDADPTSSQETPIATRTHEDASVDAAEMCRVLADHSKALPISQAALNVCEMVEADSFNAEQLTAVLRRDTELADKFLKLANNSYYNPSGKAIDNVLDAVVRVGQKRVGEFSLAMSTFASIAPKSLPWLNLSLAWRHSVVAGIAMEYLISQGKHSSRSNGLLFSALMHGAGRIVLASHFPDRYLDMVERCAEQKEPLQYLEGRMFPESHAETLCGLLTSWGIAGRYFEPLKYSLRGYDELSTMPDPIRSKSELVKLAILLGRIALERWEDWELVEFPSEGVLIRNRIHDVGAIIEQTRNQLPGISGIHFSAEDRAAERRKIIPAPPLAYRNLSAQPFDFLAPVVSSMGVRLFPFDLDADAPRGPVLVNRIGAVPDQSTIKLFHGCEKVIFVRDVANTSDMDPRRTEFNVPCSYAALRSVCVTTDSARK